jgi:hypothetical protein
MSFSSSSSAHKHLLSCHPDKKEAKKLTARQILAASHSYTSLSVWNQNSYLMSGILGTSPPPVARGTSPFVVYICKDKTIKRISRKRATAGG